MGEVKALQIWQRLAGECGEAVDYYRDARMPQEQVLERGKADFDKKCIPNDECEKEHYRADYYVSNKGYMDMHIKQNLTALQHCFNDDIPQPLLFVDFGCGPMTAGLALAELLSRQTKNYKATTAYFCVDASVEMLKKTVCINTNYNLFNRDRFKVVKDTRLNVQKIPRPFSAPHVAVLCFSFVLAPKTCKLDPQSIAQLARDWKIYVEDQPACKETIIVYQNPEPAQFHENWGIFKREMLAGGEGKVCYTPGKPEPLSVFLHPNKPPNILYFDMICGIRK